MRWLGQGTYQLEYIVTSWKLTWNQAIYSHREVKEIVCLHKYPIQSDACLHDPQYGILHCVLGHPPTWNMDFLKAWVQETLLLVSRLTNIYIAG